MTNGNGKTPAPHEAGPPRPRQAPRPTPNAGVERVIAPRGGTPPAQQQVLRPRGGPPAPRGVR
jgi:hypothetical protein